MPHHDIHIVGAGHQPGALETIRSFETGTELELEREPTNEYDPNAVMVSHNGEKLGYIPRDWAPEVCRLIEAGRFERCVTRADGSRKIVIHYTDED